MQFNAENKMHMIVQLHDLQRSQYRHENNSLEKRLNAELSNQVISYYNQV
jgi:hypothetical protein